MEKEALVVKEGGSHNSGGDIFPPAPQERPDWCTCGICRPMPTAEENKRCGKVRCVTSFVTFRNICTDRDVLIFSIRARCDIRADEPNYSTNSYRKAAYRQYIKAIYGVIKSWERAMKSLSILCGPYHPTYFPC